MFYMWEDGLRVAISIDQKQRQNRRGLPDSKLLSFASPKESNQRKGDLSFPPLRGSLRCSTGQAAAELALRAQTVLTDYP
jgi:hypothetical protein